MFLIGSNSVMFWMIEKTCIHPIDFVQPHLWLVGDMFRTRGYILIHPVYLQQCFRISLYSCRILATSSSILGSLLSIHWHIGINIIMMKLPKQSWNLATISTSMKQSTFIVLLNPKHSPILVSFLAWQSRRMLWILCSNIETSGWNCLKKSNYSCNNNWTNWCYTTM